MVSGQLIKLKITYLYLYKFKHLYNSINYIKYKKFQLFGKWLLQNNTSNELFGKIYVSEAKMDCYLIDKHEVKKHYFFITGTTKKKP